MESKPKSFIYADYMQLPGQKFNWLIKPIVPASGKVLIYAEGKVGKSFAALQLCGALTGADPTWFGMTPEITGPVLYIQLDTPSGIWKERMEKSVRLGHVNLTNTHFADKQTFVEWPFDICKPEHWQIVRDECNRIKPIAVVVDVIREFHTGNEDKNDYMKLVMDALETAVRPAALIIVGHSKKPGEVPQNIINAFRGSNYLVGNVDTIIRFTKKGMQYVGRAAEETRIKLDRTESGTWKLSEDKPDDKPEIMNLDEAIALVLSQSPKLSIHQKAQKVAELTELDFEACRSAIRRHTK